MLIGSKQILLGPIGVVLSKSLYWCIRNDLFYLIERHHDEIAINILHLLIPFFGSKIINTILYYCFRYCKLKKTRYENFNIYVHTNFFFFLKLHTNFFCWKFSYQQLFPSAHCLCSLFPPIAGSDCSLKGNRWTSKAKTAGPKMRSITRSLMDQLQNENK